jgi:hypothetical protein
MLLKEEHAMNQFDEIQKASKESMDVAMKSFGAVTQGSQAIVAECSGYTKKMIEDSTASIEKMSQAKSLDKAFEVQSALAKSQYEGCIGFMTKLNEMMIDTAKNAYKPYETMFAKATK